MIRVESLCKTYRIGFWRKRCHALKGISFSVERGEIFGLIGPNGAGKSTAIKILVGLLSSSEGHVDVLGGSPRDSSSRRKLGYLPELPYFYDYLKGSELLRHYAVLSGIKRTHVAGRVEDCVRQAGIDQEWLQRPLRSYSKGMVQRIGIAQALLAQPELLVLDEPMSGLDPLGRRMIRELIRGFKDSGVTVLYSSHVMSDVTAICDRVALMIEGHIRRLGPVAEVIGHDADLEETLAREALRHIP